mmetsp:Transcript_18096/g.28618  ORF Transcript_18096/g.28618 Transcript_18096/m.28618 type:complete len:205 (+) Transcript_18096:918-1532(+)
MLLFLLALFFQILLTLFAQHFGGRLIILFILVDGYEAKCGRITRLRPMRVGGHVLETASFFARIKRRHRVRVLVIRFLQRCIANLVQVIRFAFLLGPRILDWHIILFEILHLLVDIRVHTLDIQIILPLFQRIIDNSRRCKITLTLFHFSLFFTKIAIIRLILVFPLLRLGDGRLQLVQQLVNLFIGKLVRSNLGHTPSAQPNR